MAGMSCISKLCEPGASTNTARVFGLNSLAMPAPISGIVVARFNAHALEHAVAEIAGRTVDAVGDQDMVAGAGGGEERCGDRRQPGRKQRHAGATLTFEFAQGVFQRFGGRRAAAAIL